MICVVLLQNCVGFVEGETGYCNETGGMCGVGGTGEVGIYEESIVIMDEVSIKVEEAVDIKQEMPEAISFPPIKTEHEVRLWGVCEVVVALAFMTICCPPPKGNCEITRN
jgi:hypothetical protein